MRLIDHPDAGSRTGERSGCGDASADTSGDTSVDTSVDSSVDSWVDWDELRARLDIDTPALRASEALDVLERAVELLGDVEFESLTPDERRGLVVGRAKMRLARALSDLPHATVAFAAGDISAEHVHRLAAARNPRTVEVFDRDEAELVDNAQRLSFKDFDRTMKHWSHHADTDGGHDPRVTNRAATIGRTYDETWHLEATFDHITGSEIDTAITHEVAAMLTEADLQRIVFDGPDVVIAMGTKQRFFRGNQRHAAQVRDRTCRGTMCDRPADRCDIDHRIPFPQGPTDLDNAQCLCRRCHGRKTAADQNPLQKE